MGLPAEGEPTIIDAKARINATVPPRLNMDARFASLALALLAFEERCDAGLQRAKA
jgi:hypothetical protein